MLGVSKKWTWHDTLTLQTPMGSVYFVHQQSSNVLQVCAAVSMNVVQAHYHTKACIHCTASPENHARGSHRGKSYGWLKAPFCKL